jgi:hypothetical protein
LLGASGVARPADEGERRHARYRLDVPLRPVPHLVIDEHGELKELDR